jgi:hypothetical protein
MEIFKVKGSNDIHMIDTRNNHFISTDGLDGTFKCVNPTGKSGLNIGDTHPPVEDRICMKIKAVK